jgi:vancomycin resistance protein YoaR
MVRSASQWLSRATTTELGAEPTVEEHATKRRLRFAASPPRIVFGILIALGALFAVLLIASVAERRIYDGRVLPGVHVAGVESSGEHETDVRDAVARLGAELARSPLRVRIDGHEMTADPSLLALTVDAEATARAAMDQGRDGGFLSQLVGTARRWVAPAHVSLRVVYDEDRLEGMLDGWSAEIDDPAVEGGLRFEGTRVVPIEPHAGTGILRPEARAALVRMLASPERDVLTLPVGTIYPQVDTAAVDAAAARARALLRGDVTIVTGRAPVNVTPVRLASAMGTRIIGDVLTLTVDPDRLHAAIGPALAAQEQPPVDATFAVTEENTVQVVPSQDGRLVDMRAVAAAILSGRRQIPAPLETVSPARDTKWAESLGIVRQVSAYTTEHPSGEARVTNIHRGADLLNNTVVEPGQVFSLNDTIGPRTQERGFVTAPVFAEGAFFDDFGGGVSQLATTVYNAAFFGGYADVTHQPHTIYISRYPAGREATVNYGSIDLQFRNDTEHGVLIRTYYSDTSVTVVFYGDNDGRTVREENRVETDPVPVTDELIECPASPKVDPYAICASLSAGETERIATGDSGFDVAFDRVIDQPGKPERREHYTWHYTMLPNRILVGNNPAEPSTTTTTKPSADRPRPGSTTPGPAQPKTAPTSGNPPR